MERALSRRIVRDCSSRTSQREPIAADATPSGLEVVVTGILLGTALLVSSADEVDKATDGSAIEGIRRVTIVL
jgi:hypothetical protein